MSADDYELLWESAFCYRDRSGAARIAGAIGEKERPFWHACFEVLANGFGDAPIGLDHISRKEVPTRSGLVFALLFSRKELAASSDSRIRAFGDLFLSSGGFGSQPPSGTVYDTYVSATKPDYWEYSGYPSSAAKEMFRLRRLMEAARLGYATCHYVEADQWTKEVIEKYQSIPQHQRRTTYWPFLPGLLYYSGRQIRAVAPTVLESSDGTRIYVPGEMRDAELDLVLLLSKEKEALAASAGR